MILIITSRDDLTADYVVLELRRRGLAFHRLNTDDLASTCTLSWSPMAKALGSIATEGKAGLNLESVVSVWYRRPVSPQVEVQSNDDQRYIGNEWKAVLENLWASLQDVLWVSRPDRIREASNKVPQLQLARKIGFRVPATIISNDAASLRAFCSTYDDNVVGKVLHSQTPAATAGSYLVYTTRIARQDLVPQMMGAPLLLQEYINKAHEIRATVVGDQVFSVAIDSQSDPDARVDWRHATLRLRHEQVELPTSVNAKLVAIILEYGLAFGAFDLIQTPEGEIVFLELNPNGQWAWLQQLTDIPIREALIDLLAQNSLS